MADAHREIDFFMGANTPEGFFSLYDTLTTPKRGDRLYLLKGGAGTGKSSLMKTCAARLGERDALVERIHCSSDPDSLDGVLFHTGRCGILDATPPHTVEPACPGGFETVVDLYRHLDEARLEQRLERITELQAANAACHKKCRSLLKCADILLGDNRCAAKACTNFSKIDALASRIGKKELPAKPHAGRGSEQKRLLSAVTARGILTYIQTVPALCDRVCLLRDDFGVSADALLVRLRETALAKGYDIYTCGSPLSPAGRLEHLFLPELRLGFVTQTNFGALPPLPGRLSIKTIHFTRFTDMERLRRKKQYLNFNRKAASALLQAAADEMRRAKSIHDELEQQYADAVDFSGVDQTTAELLARLEQRYPN